MSDNHESNLVDINIFKSTLDDFKFDASSVISKNSQQEVINLKIALNKLQDLVQYHELKPILLQFIRSLPVVLDEFIKHFDKETSDERNLRNFRAFMLIKLCNMAVIDEDLNHIFNQEEIQKKIALVEQTIKENENLKKEFDRFEYYIEALKKQEKLSELLRLAYLSQLTAIEWQLYELKQDFEKSKSNLKAKVKDSLKDVNLPEEAKTKISNRLTDEAVDLYIDFYKKEKAKLAARGRGNGDAHPQRADQIQSVLPYMNLHADKTSISNRILNNKDFRNQLNKMAEKVVVEVTGKHDQKIIDQVKNEGINAVMPELHDLALQKERIEKLESKKNKVKQNCHISDIADERLIQDEILKDIGKAQEEQLREARKAQEEQLEEARKVHEEDLEDEELTIKIKP